MCSGRGAAYSRATCLRAYVALTHTSTPLIALLRPQALCTQHASHPGGRIRAHACMERHALQAAVREHHAHACMHACHSRHRGGSQPFDGAQLAS